MVAMNIKIRDSDARANGGPRHGAHAVHPATMIVKDGARGLIAQHALQLCEVGSTARCDLEHDQTWHRKFVEGKAAAEPGLKQFGGFLFRKRLDLCNAGVVARGRHGFIYRGIEVAAGRRRYLNRYLTRDVRLPFASGPAHEHGGARGQRCKESHDGNDRDERATGN